MDFEGAEGGGFGVDGDGDEGDFVGRFDAVQGRKGDVGEVFDGTVGHGGAFAVPGAEFDDGVGCFHCVEGCEFGVVGEGGFGPDVRFVCWFAADGLLRRLG